MIDETAYRIRSLPFGIGRSRDEDLSNPAWPEHVGRFELADGAPGFVFGLDGTIDGRSVPAARRAPVGDGSVLTVGPLAIRICHASLVPVCLRLVSEPRGGRLEARATPEAAPVIVALSVLRARLLATLLRAGSDHPVEDESLIEAVWHRGAVRTRLDVNQLGHRARGDLARLGFDARAMLVRNPRGGATSIRVPTETRVEID